MKLTILTLLCFVTFISPLRAQECYQPIEAEAEQGIRIHSELMVIGLNCAHKTTDGGTGLYISYKEFTNKHADLFVKYENILMDHFKKSGQDAEKAINKLRTGFANKISNDSAKMRPDVFCSLYAPRITQIAALDHDMMRKWAATIYPTHPVSLPVCAPKTETKS